MGNIWIHKEFTCKSRWNYESAHRFFLRTKGVYTRTCAHTHTTNGQKKPHQKTTPFLKAIYFLFLTLKKLFILSKSNLSCRQREFPKHLAGKKAAKGLPRYTRNSPQEFLEWRSRRSEAAAACDNEGIWEPRQPIIAAGARAPSSLFSSSCSHAQDEATNRQATPIFDLASECYCYYFPNNN